MGQVQASSMWHCGETSFWDWLVWVNQLMRNYSSNDKNMLMYSTAIYLRIRDNNLWNHPVNVFHSNFRSKLIYSTAIPQQKSGNRGAPHTTVVEVEGTLLLCRIERDVKRFVDLAALDLALHIFFSSS